MQRSNYRPRDEKYVQRPSAGAVGQINRPLARSIGGVMRVANEQC